MIQLPVKMVSSGRLPRRPALGCGTWSASDPSYISDVVSMVLTDFPKRTWGKGRIVSWLVVDLPLWKIWKSIGMIIPNNYMEK